MKLCVVIPALNEETTITDVIREIPNEIPGISSVSVCVVDDGSTDRTVELAKEAGASVTSHPENRGVGAAFQTGVTWALGQGVDVMVNIDGDAQFDPTRIPELIDPILAGKADVVTASRFANKDVYPEMSKVKFYGNQVMAFLISTLARRKFHDVSCGFRAFSRDALLKLNLFGGFTYTQETFLDLTFKGARIAEVPMLIRRGVREHGKSRVASNVLAYAYKSTKIIFRSYRDYKPLRIFGALAGLLWFIAALLLGFVCIHRITAGAFTPYKSVGLLGGLLLAMGLLIFTTGLVADMLARIRITQERILYQLRDRDSSRKPM